MSMDNYVPEHASSDISDTVGNAVREFVCMETRVATFSVCCLPADTQQSLWSDLQDDIPLRSQLMAWSRNWRLPECCSVHSTVPYMRGYLVNLLWDRSQVRTWYNARSQARRCGDAAIGAALVDEMCWRASESLWDTVRSNVTGRCVNSIRGGLGGDDDS
jgi:hypothetical protein